MTVKAKFPKALEFLSQPARYKVLWGGRGGSKSWGVARWLLLEGVRKPLRILCAREIQKSLEDSVHHLLKSQIEELRLGANYEVQKSTIIGTNGTAFIFAGLKHNVTSIKSLEAIDRVFIEEAQAVSKDSWDTLIPTIRKKDSELLIVFNPLLESDETYKRFVLNPPPGAVVRKISFRDNPFFPEVLRIEAEHLAATDPKAYRHVWEGEPRSSCDGAIYAAEIAEAEHDGRIGDVPRDRTRPVDTYWDLGFGDCTAIWFAQSMPDGRHRVIDYLESSGKTIEWYLIQLQQKGYLYGTDWLPHDGVDMIIHAKLGADPSRSIEMLMRQAGRKVRIAPKMHITTGINAARTLFGSCWFDRAKCADGLQALRHYQWGPPTTSGVESRAPKHDQYSHGADAFRTMSFGAKTPLAAPVPRMQPPPQYSSGDRGWMR